jgi:hypothetical protein
MSNDILNDLLQRLLDGPEDAVLPKGFQDKLRIAMGDAAIRKDAGADTAEANKRGMALPTSPSTQTLNPVMLFEGVEEPRKTWCKERMVSAWDWVKAYGRDTPEKQLEAAMERMVGLEFG